MLRDWTIVMNEQRKRTSNVKESYAEIWKQKLVHTVDAKKKCVCARKQRQNQIKCIQIFESKHTKQDEKTKKIWRNGKVLVVFDLRPKRRVLYGVTDKQSIQGGDFHLGFLLEHAHMLLYRAFIKFLINLFLFFQLFLNLERKS